MKMGSICLILYKSYDENPNDVRLYKTCQIIRRVGYKRKHSPLIKEFYKYAVSTVNVESPVKVKSLSIGELRTPRLFKQSVKSLLVNPIRRSISKSCVVSSSIIKEHKVRSDVKSPIIKPSVSLGDLSSVVIRGAKLESLFSSYLTKKYSLSVNITTPVKLRYKLKCLFEADNTKQLYELLKQLLSVES